MNANKQNNQKRLYITPKIKKIRLDNEISLQLESVPPEGPGENLGRSTECFNNDPFKTYLT